MPVGRPGFNHEHSATSRVGRFARHDAQDQQARQHVEQVQSGEHVTEDKIVVARNGMALRDFRRIFVGLEHDQHRPARPANVGQPQSAGMVLDPGMGCDGDAPRSHSSTAGTGCGRDRRTVSFPYGGTHVLTPSMGGCEFERCSGTPAAGRFALNGCDQHVRVLDALPKFSSR